ncbi:MAG: exodeoxyribonuclease VII large subunit [Bacteroidia bacterium]
MNESGQMRLSEFCALISDAIKMTFADKVWWVIAEIKERNDKGDHIYFELVEKAENSNELLARISASVWRREAVAAFRNFEDITGKRPEAGMQVLVKAGVAYHPVYGLSLQLFDIDSQHMLGQLELLRRRTIQQLASKPHIRLVDGELITPNKQLKLEPVIQNVAIITSASAAGFGDFTHTLQNNPYGYHIAVTPYFSILQGDKAAAAIKEKLIEIYKDTQIGKKYDAVVLIRGGGAQSDLLPFDDYALSHAVAKFPVPVIVGVGHLKNRSIADMAAHTSVKTPTQAAEFIIGHNLSYEEKIMGLRELIILRTKKLLESHRRKLEHNSAILTGGTIRMIGIQKNRLSVFSEKLLSMIEKFSLRKNQQLEQHKELIRLSSLNQLKSEKHRLQLLEEKIRLLNPELILKRGFAIVRKEENIIVKAGQLNIDENIRITFSDGSIEATVTKNNSEHE